jgi:enoyl-CoA hydratase/carnithine racemase
MPELASGKLLLDEPAEGVARLRISNPERRGALDHEILDTLAETAGSLDARCLLLTGEGKMFSAGYDLGNLEGQQFEQAAERLVAHPFHAAIEALEAYEYPVVAAINGHAIGGGLELALTADIRLAAREVKLGMPPAKLGLIYSHTGLKKFIEVCGVANTAELFHVGRNVDAERGLAMGLVNQVVEPEELDERAVELAGEIAANAPLSLSGNKRIMRALREHPGRLPEELERELIELRESCFRSEDFREGVRAFAEKRRPEWQGR